MDLPWSSLSNCAQSSAAKFLRFFALGEGKVASLRVVHLYRNRLIRLQAAHDSGHAMCPMALTAANQVVQRLTLLYWQRFLQQRVAFIHFGRHVMNRHAELLLAMV